MSSATTTRPRKTLAPATESIINNATHVFTDVPCVVEQGDLYFVAIPGLPKSAKPRVSRQLADGTTQGSRHVLTVGEIFDADPVEMSRIILDATTRAGRPCLIDHSDYIGPVFQTTEGRAYVEHPEHGDHDFRVDCTMAVVFQRSLDAEERAQRVAD